MMINNPRPRGWNRPRIPRVLPRIVLTTTFEGEGSNATPGEETFSLLPLLSTNSANTSLAHKLIVTQEEFARTVEELARTVDDDLARAVEFARDSGPKLS